MPSLKVGLTVGMFFAGAIFSYQLYSQTEFEKEITKTLSDIVLEQQQAWNEGDLPQFMNAYWESKELTFSSGGKTHRGWETTLKRYQTNYPDKAIMGKLTFTDLEAMKLGNDSAMMLGRWHLERTEPAEGNFTLVWRKINGDWKIVHDHSSLERPEE